MSSVLNDNYSCEGPTCTFPAEHFPSWEDFKSFVSANLLKGLPPVQNRYLFRGQGNAEWHLESKFDRTFLTLPPAEAPSKHELLLAHFRNNCQYFPAYRSATQNDLVCLALAQHHGLPTRLLDWTDSPYIAAYFAFVHRLKFDHGAGRTGADGNVGIWILDMNVKHFWNGEYGVQAFRPEAWENERQKRQFGWFTYAKTPYRYLEHYVKQMGADSNALRKITIPTSVALTAISDLSLMRINALELFPDLGGAAESLCYGPRARMT